MKENKTWFKSGYLPDWSINLNAIEKMAIVTRGYKRMGVLEYYKENSGSDEDEKRG